MVTLYDRIEARTAEQTLKKIVEINMEDESYINEGKEAYNAQIPLSQGIADQQIQIAEGYAIDRVNRAKGDVARFNAIYSEYQKAPSVTRERLYLEMMEEMFKNTKNAVIIDKELQNMLPIKNITSPSNNHENGGNQ